MMNTRLGGLCAVAATTILWTASSLMALQRGSCIDVADGDSMVVELAGEHRMVHLFGIDAPELDQPMGPDAAELLRAEVQGRELSLDIRSQEDGEFTAVIGCGDQDVARRMVENGLAWLSESGDTDEAYAVALFMARAEERGVWSDPEAEHPADWRRDHVVSPTPTPTWQALAEVVSSVELKKDDDGKVVIDASDAPSVYARSAEGRLFIARMTQIAQVKRWYTQAEWVWNAHCRGSSSHDSGSVWSDELGAWIDSSAAPRECDDLADQMSQAERWIREVGALAIAEAERGGISPADVKAAAAAVGLEN